MSSVSWGEWIKAERKKRFMTQQKLSEVLGVTHMTVLRWEKGKHDPSLYLRDDLQRVLGSKL